jgi:integrase
MNGRKARGELGGRNSKLTLGRVLDHFLTVLPARVGPDTLEIQKLVIEAHVRTYFGAMKADKLTTQMLLAYRESRGQEKTNKGTFTRPSTINRELSLLRNALRTAAFSTPPLLSISCIPRFPITNEDEFARQGFITDEQFETLISELPSYLIPITTVSFNTGIRMGELLKVQWAQVDFEAQLIRLYRGETKGKRPRMVPMLGNMRRMLVAAKAERDEYWPECDFVFHRLGQRLNDFRGAWASACERAGLTELLFHDLRRSGVRLLSRSGVPERVIMSITGHRTREMFDRYNITSEADLADAAARVKAFRESKTMLGSDLNSDKNRDSRSETATATEGTDGR